KSTYYNGFFVVKKYSGIPCIKEPEKCSDLKWFNIEKLPDNLLPDRKQALQNYLLNIYYDEFGWNRKKDH
ncbi:MAG: hypothetical protein FWC47_17340, partial [Oscillospiraceae bacterium]|nr:hypothetical protein [Oscillospiraceae bacterium]